MYSNFYEMLCYFKNDVKTKFSCFSFFQLFVILMYSTFFFLYIFIVYLKKNA